MIYDRHNPFIAPIIERKMISGTSSGKKTTHVSFDISESELFYSCGDSVGIIPQNSPELVRKTLEALGMSGYEEINLKRSNQIISLNTCLTSFANITSVSRKLFESVLHRQTNTSKKSLLLFFQEENREGCEKYLQEFEVWDFLLEHSEVRFRANEISEHLLPLLPRFYSIASSQNYVGKELHIVFASVEYESRGQSRRGVCTHYLSDLASPREKEVPIFIQESRSFRLPQDPHKPLIMVGPGTGVAPFRAFVQERFHHLQSEGKHWLFFGGRNRECDFLYQDEWETWQQKGNLRIETAFSRDQEHKIYVQDKMLENGEELFSWLEEGAYFYVCGDATSMAKDVEASLQKIIEIYGKKSSTEAKEYIKSLRLQKRYLRDIY